MRHLENQHPDAYNSLMLDDKAAVLFDAGHTLLEPRVPVVEVYHELALRVGADVPRPAFAERFAGLWRILASAFRADGEDLATSDARERENWRRFTGEIARPFPELERRHEEWLAALFTYFDDPDAWLPAPGARAVLATLACRGVRMGVVSNWHTVLHAILRGHGIESCFSFVLTSAEIGHRKPHARIFSSAIEKVGLPPSQIAHVGDSWDEDVEGALAAGITPIYLERGNSDLSECRENIVKIRALNELIV